MMVAPRKQPRQIRTGATIGSYTVVGGEQIDPDDGRIFHSCRCACGETVNVTRCNLLSGRATKCRACGSKKARKAGTERSAA